MTLRSFHAVFISASALLAFFFAAWCLAPAPPGAGRLAAAAGSAAAGVGLLAYEAWFLRKTSPGRRRPAPGRERGRP
jgi:hypothetical protein